MDQIYHRLAEHLRDLIMGYPFSEALLDLLREMYSPEEAAVLLGLPNDRPPLEVVEAGEAADRLGLTSAEVEPVLARLAERNLLYSAPTPQGRPGYALLQVGYGMPQTFFWGGRLDERARKMAGLVISYFRTGVTRQVYGGTATKSYRYVPANLSLDLPLQGVMPGDLMEPLVEAATRIGLAHCPCRMSARALGRGDCGHSLEVCLKYDELAEFVIDRGLARAISHNEALAVLKKSEQEGLVHMADNARGQIKHTCNCCGHWCWNVGLINRRRVPRDALMAVYYLRRTELDECIGCGACAEICPVRAVTMVEDRPVVDLDWCLGCGVCAGVCPAGAISLSRRDQTEPPADLGRLFQRLRSERPA